MEDNGKNDFSLMHYSKCLDIAINSGYSFYKMKDVDMALKDNMSIIMRHDVDTQLDVAVEMAKIEFKKQICSTFFIRFHSHSYNPLCLKDARKIRKISSLGHEVGLHYESDFYSLINSDSNYGMLLEINLLKEIIGKDIKSIAPHEPTRTGIKNIDNKYAKSLNIKYQAYDKLFFDNFRYISDSSCRWRDGSMRYHVENKTSKKLYILTHPYWWYHSSPIENY